MAGVTLNTATSTISTTQQGGTGNVLLALNAITRNTGALANFSVGGTAVLNTNAITTTTTNDATGILGGWAVYGGSNYAAVTTGNIVPYTAYTVAVGTTIADGSSTNVNLTGTGATFTASGNEISINNSADATNAVTISGTNALGITTVAASGTGTSTGVAAAVSATIPAPDLSTEGLTVNGKAVDLTGAKSLQDVSDAINAKGIDGVSAAVSADGKGINFYSNSALTLTDTGGNIVGANAKDVNANATYTLGTAAATGGSLAGGSVGTVDGANDLISRIDVALSSVADFAAQLGAVQNRFQSTISTLSSQSTNLKASQSTIQDADFAAETANLSKAQVLQQAGISVLSQANSNPQQVLKLLQ